MNSKSKTGRESVGKKKRRLIRWPSPCPHCKKHTGTGQPPETVLEILSVLKNGKMMSRKQIEDAIGTSRQNIHDLTRRMQRNNLIFLPFGSSTGVFQKTKHGSMFLGSWKRCGWESKNG